jgi:hypothetical protein
MTKQSSPHIHIVGCLPRSGTTLMTEVMVNCFDIDGYTDHEQSIFREYTKPYTVLCTKNPNDIKRIRFPLKVNPDLYVIYLLRDPRDAISSRSHLNNKAGHTIWGTLGEWQAHQEIADSLIAHPHFIVVKYEDLVSSPDQVQAMLCERLPFLTVKAKFSEYHLVAQPSKKSNDALGGVRPISPVSVGSWHQNKAFLKAQLAEYGDITEQLISLGYETNSHWLNELNDVVADNSEAPKPKHSARKLWWYTWFTLPRRCLMYWLSCAPVIGPLLSRLRSALRQASKQSE